MLRERWGERERNGEATCTHESGKRWRTREKLDGIELIGIVHREGKKEAEKMNKNTNKSPTPLSFPSISYINVMVAFPRTKPHRQFKEK